MAKCDSNSIFEDNVMSVQYVPLTPNKKDQIESEIAENDKEMQVGSSLNVNNASTSTRSSRSKRRSRSNSSSLDATDNSDDIDTTDYYAHECKLPSRRRHRNRRSRSWTVNGARTSPDNISQWSQLLLQQIKEQGVSMAYICQLKPRPGALSLEKCVSFGVPPGPLLGKLKSGQDVTLESGTVVRSKDVCEPDDPGPVFIVVDCPNVDYLDSLLENEAFEPYQCEAPNETKMATVVVHFSPKDVIESARYKSWIERFGTGTEHLILNESNTCLGSIAVHRIQYKLNMLHPDIFPLLGNVDMKTECDKNNCRKKMKMDSGFEENSDLISEAVGTFCTYHLRPRKGLDKSLELKLKPDEYCEEALKIEGMAQLLHNLKSEINQQSSRLTARPHPEILFLGTGSCIPNKTRNTSGILLKTSESCCIIVDCGEGTYGQLVRFYGCKKVDEVLANVRAIYISHLHADHHIGLIGILCGRRRALKNLKVTTSNPVLLFAPRQILTWLSFYDKCFEDIATEFELIANGDLLLNENNLNKGTKMRILNTLEMSDFNTCLVRHCPNAFGIAFTHKNGYKITYSGDTMPCDNLVQLGMNSDLLIHEATMEDELSHEAVLKLHSTTSQAINIGREMKAKSTLLTHFSQRYAKIPRFNDSFSGNIGIAFDNMQVKLDELSLMPLLYPALKVMFAEHYEELEHKAAKRQMKIERRKEASKERQNLVER